jgi:hypothetical protein
MFTCVIQAAYAHGHADAGVSGHHPAATLTSGPGVTMPRGRHPVGPTTGSVPMADLDTTERRSRSGVAVSYTS